jgi:hypothetical protein
MPASLYNTEHHERKYNQDARGLSCRQCKGRIHVMRIKHRLIKKHGGSLTDQTYTFMVFCPNCEKTPDETGPDIRE